MVSLEARYVELMHRQSIDEGWIFEVEDLCSEMVYKWDIISDHPIFIQFSEEIIWPVIPSSAPKELQCTICPLGRELCTGYRASQWILQRKHKAGGKNMLKPPCETHNTYSEFIMWQRYANNMLKTLEKENIQW